MNVIKNWLGTIVGAVVLLLIVLLEVTDSANKVKLVVWIVGLVILAGGVAFDLYRQGKLKAPTA